MLPIDRRMGTLTRRHKVNSMLTPHRHRPAPLTAATILKLLPLQRSVFLPTEKPVTIKLSQVVAGQNDN